MLGVEFDHILSLFCLVIILENHAAFLFVFGVLFGSEHFVDKPYCTLFLKAVIGLIFIHVY
jgi:hypothetical protein